jgi:hypothetical protein
MDLVVMLRACDFLKIRDFFARKLFVFSAAISQKTKKSQALSRARQDFWARGVEAPLLNQYGVNPIGALRLAPKAAARSG